MKTPAKRNQQQLCAYDQKNLSAEEYHVDDELKTTYMPSRVLTGFSELAEKLSCAQQRAKKLSLILGKSSKRAQVAAR